MYGLSGLDWEMYGLSMVLTGRRMGVSMVRDVWCVYGPGCMVLKGRCMVCLWS